MNVTLMICGGIMLLMYIAILALILADLWAGVRKAKKRGEYRTSDGYKRTKSSDGYCLDNIVAKGFYMADVKTFPYELSDHYPFVCRLMLKQN